MISHPFRLEGRRIWVCGHGGMVGSAVLRRLATEECVVLTESRQKLDLRRQRDVEQWIADHRPDVVVVAAAVVGGLQANAAYPVEFLSDNLAIAQHVIDAAAGAGVERLLYLGSSCVYPRLAPQPIAEDALLTGPLEPTNQWYAMAKLAGLKLVEAYHRERGLDYITAIPANLYGPFDTFDPDRSHVIPGLIRRMHTAAQQHEPVVRIWGTGTPRREFMHVDDCADALVHLLRSFHQPEPINVGTGGDTSIAELARMVADVTSYTGSLQFDPSKPDGMPRKGLDSSRLASLGWSGGRPLEDGLAQTYAWFLNHEMHEVRR
jgi:GDP-L-fucose synthase